MPDFGAITIKVFHVKHCRWSLRGATLIAHQ